MGTLYPAANDTDTSLYVSKNGAETTLDSTIDNTVTSVPGANVVGYPADGIITIDAEAIKYASATTGIHGTFNSCTRGYDGTTAASHSANAKIRFSPVADHHNALKDAIIALEKKVGNNTNGASATTMDGNQLASGTIHSAAVADIDILFRKMKLENAVTRVGSIQNGIGTIAVTAGTWANAGTAVTITPAVNSLIMAWGWISGIHSVGTSDYLRFQFNGGNGDNGALGGANRDDALGVRTIHVIDTFAATAGAVTLQLQMQTDNTGTWTFAAAKAVQLRIFALAIPSS